MEIRGKNILITGSADRVGKSIAIGLAQEGANIAVHYYSAKQPARTTIQEIAKFGVKACAFKADFHTIKHIKRLIDQVDHALGSIDVLINSASLFFPTPVHSIKESQWDSILHVNLKAAFFCCKYASKYMLKKGNGKIINISDIGALIPWKFYVPYCISKAGLIAMTKALAKEFAPSILVNAIAPGTILPGKKLSPNAISKLKHKTLLNTIGSPNDIVECVKFILKSNFTTGSVFIIDGGQLLKSGTVR